MDIHPPEGPAHSFKEFVIHILIVTVGILIALGLEGARETWRERTAVTEVRESFKRELRQNRQQLGLEMKSVRKVNAGLDQILADFTQSNRSAAELADEAVNILPGFYFFSTTAWETAVASGVLTHMKADELNHFADAYLSIRNYQDAEKGAIPDWIELGAWFASRHTLAPADRITGEEKLRVFKKKMQLMEHLGAEFGAGLKAALGAE